jgi:hypothetical protein
MKTLKVSALITALNLCIVSGGAAGGQARHDGAAKMKGVWGGWVQGTRGATLPAGGPFAAILVLTLDGSGSFSGIMNASLNGFIIGPTSVNGTYQVNPDGTGSLVIHFPGVPDTHVDFVLVDNGKEMVSLQTDPDHVNIAILKRR